VAPLEVVYEETDRDNRQRTPSLSDLIELHQSKVYRQEDLRRALPLLLPESEGACTARPERKAAAAAAGAEETGSSRWSGAMPLSRHTVASEYSLAAPQLYKHADQRDPEAVLDGVAMAGLVGVLRQLGDLAEFAAEVFHGLYDEVMTASARGHGLVLRAQQLEAELPILENDICQTDYLYVASNKGVDWHANPRVDHGVVTTGDTPRFIMNSMKRCHGPPRLFMLDKYDIGGEGTCLKRYSDPAFFKTDSACSRRLQDGIRRERRPIRTMVINSSTLVLILQLVHL